MPHDTRSARRLTCAVVAVVCRVNAFIVLASACAGGCKQQGSGASSTPDERGSERAKPSVVVDLNHERPWSEPYAHDALWLRARQGDAIDLYELAQREGSAGLMRALRTGGSLGQLAASALPLAPDRSEASVELCELLGAAEPRSRYSLLLSLHGIWLAPVPLAAELGVDVAGACNEQLGALVQAATLAPREHDLALSARALIERNAGAAHAAD